MKFWRPPWRAFATSGTSGYSVSARNSEAPRLSGTSIATWGPRDSATVATRAALHCATKGHSGHVSIAAAALSTRTEAYSRTTLVDTSSKEKMRLRARRPTCGAGRRGLGTVLGAGGAARHRLLRREPRGLTEEGRGAGLSSRLLDVLLSGERRERLDAHGHGGSACVSAERGDGRRAKEEPLRGTSVRGGGGVNLDVPAPACCCCHCAGQALVDDHTGQWSTHQRVHRLEHNRLVKQVLFPGD